MVPNHTSRALLLALLLAGLLLGLQLGLLGRAGAEPRADLGYGFNVAALDVALVQDIGFDWVKVFGPPGSRLPLNVLVRFDAKASDLDDVAGFGGNLGQIAAKHGAKIEAYEIGNEVNLDATYGWGDAPVAAEYATLLCAAYDQIKAADPGAIVVSAGLAPTGRVTGNWEGHAGHNGAYQDEREYLKEFLAAGGADCADAIGYHPYGFSADYDAPPDLVSADPGQNCQNGFCFRGVEKIHQLLVAGGAGEKPVWATEFGWLMRPPADCLDDPSFRGREWQLVSAEKQAANLQGAYEYAAARWPWMGAMFVFNLNFNTVGWYEKCEQMRYYGIEDRPAEQALRALFPEPLPPRLTVAPARLLVLAEVADQPLAATRPLLLGNGGDEPLVYTATVGGGDLITSLAPAQGTLPAQGEQTLLVGVASQGRPPGSYSANVRVDASPGVLDAPATVPVTLMLVEELHHVHLPLIGR